jgi:hypothetical protein
MKYPVDKTKCNHTNCKNKVTWLVGGQWYMCDDHVDEAVAELREYVNSDIKAVSLIDSDTNYILSGKQLETISSHHIGGKEWEVTRKVMQQQYVPMKQQLEKVKEKFIAINDNGECIYPNNEPDDCDSSRCGLCVLERVIEELCKECDNNERTNE